MAMTTLLQKSLNDHRALGRQEQSSGSSCFSTWIDAKVIACGSTAELVRDDARFQVQVPMH